MKPIRALDLACGAGGWACAARGLPIEFVAVADIAPDCLETWCLNNRAAYPGCRVLQCDLATPEGVDAVLDAVCCAGPGREPPVDLVLGAIPCEPLSCARANRPLKPGEMENTHALIDTAFDLVQRLRPRWWCFEDVIAVEDHLPPPIVLGIPYECRRIDSSLYGPQKRIRAFFGVFPPAAPPEPGPRTLGEILRPGPYRTLPQPAKYKRSKSKLSPPYHYSSRHERAALLRAVDPEQPSPTILSKTRHGGTGNENTHCVPVERELRGRENPAQSDRPGRTVVSGKTGEQAVEQEDMIRVLEWQEAALLQGFPPDYTFAASWSRTWKLVAQAISIHVGRAILKGIVQASF